MWLLKLSHLLACASNQLIWCITKWICLFFSNLALNFQSNFRRWWRRQNNWTTHVFLGNRLSKYHLWILILYIAIINIAIKCFLRKAIVFGKFYLIVIKLLKLVLSKQWASSLFKPFILVFLDIIVRCWSRCFI